MSRRKTKTKSDPLDVTAPNKEASLDPTPELTGKIVNAAIVNLRNDIEDPLSSKILDTLYYGETVKILQQTGNICKVETRANKIGYVFSKYVEVLSNE